MPLFSFVREGETWNGTQRVQTNTEQSWKNEWVLALGLGHIWERTRGNFVSVENYRTGVIKLHQTLTLKLEKMKESCSNTLLIRFVIYIYTWKRTKPRKSVTIAFCWAYIFDQCSFHITVAPKNKKVQIVYFDTIYTFSFNSDFWSHFHAQCWKSWIEVWRLISHLIKQNFIRILAGNRNQITSRGSYSFCISVTTIFTDRCFIFIPWRKPEKKQHNGISLNLLLMNNFAKSFKWSIKKC